MVDVIEKDKCTGCKLCGDVCPNGAITFETDEQGFWYPAIDRDKCINCDVCEQKCPALNPVNNPARNEPKVYAAWSKDSDTRIQSTSGGIFWEIASAFIKDGGAVVGSVWEDDCKSARHVIAHDMNELRALRGSKYIQSDTEGIYCKIKDEINKGMPLLFCGTPCQNAAVQKIIGSEEKNIYYLDFICRSINSPLAFKKYVEEKERAYGSKAVKVHLKDKTKGWQSLASRIEFENGEVSLKNRDNDAWVRGFLKGDLYTRECCFSCQYRKLPRNIADVTVGDFWGIEDEAPYDMYCGISVVMVNTMNGEFLLNGAKDNLFLKEKKLEDVIGGNPALLNSPARNGKRDEFFKVLDENGFVESVKYVLKENMDEEKFKSPRDVYEEDVRKYNRAGVIDENLYFYLNFECKNIVHNGKGRIIPYQNVVIDMHPTAKIVIDGDNDFELGTNLLLGSRAETLIRLEHDSCWNIRHGGFLFYGTTLEIKENAIFDSGFFSMNTGSVLIVAKRIVFGEDVMLGRNIVIYDSDFHRMLDMDGTYINPPEEVVVGNHVWLTGNINVNKGVTIGEGSIVANQTVVTKNIPPYSLVAGQSVGKVIKENVIWSRKSVSKYKDVSETRKMILYGYGIEGKRFYRKHKDHISFVIDNFDKSDCVVDFATFRNEHEVMNSEEFLWVIASPNHFDELYNDVRSYYKDALVVSYSDI